MAHKALVPAAQKEVIFYDEMITAVLLDEKARPEIYVPVRPVCDYLGVDWSAQNRRINRDPILGESIKGIAITTTPSLEGRGDGLQELLCLPLKFIPGWLFCIRVSPVKSELQDKIVWYRRECYDMEIGKYTRFA